jgi:hypothetical protein
MYAEKEEGESSCSVIPQHFLKKETRKIPLPKKIIQNNQTFSVFKLMTNQADVVKESISQEIHQLATLKPSN